MYTIGQLARLAGVTTRTLRYYDQIGLLRPQETSPAGYRLYGPAQVDKLQQILFYSALGVGPEAIRRIMNDPSFDRRRALEAHLEKLLERRYELDALIGTVRKTLSAQKEGFDMTDEEKFEGLKRRYIEDNARQYGAEARALYGGVVDQSNAKLMGMTPAQFARLEALAGEIGEALKDAARSGDPAGEEARRLCGLHKEWLAGHWSRYSAAAHRALAQTYVDDARFAAYYDGIVTGGAVFLRDALLRFLPEK